jgi:hypothetical protein
MDVAAVVRGIAASGLAGADLPWPCLPLEADEWTELVRVVRTERLAGLLVHAISVGSLPVTTEQADHARRERFDGTLRVLVIENGMLTTIRRLSVAGVDVRILKGSAVARLDYLDPSLRLFGDLDVLVPAHQFDQAVAALTEAGHARLYPQARPGFDRRFSKGTTFRADDGLEIDLHRTFVMGPFGLRVALEDLWGEGSSFTVGETQLRALDPEVRFLHACFHAALGNVVPRLVPQRDVAQMLLTGRLDMDRVEVLLQRWQAAGVVARAVSCTWRTLGLTETMPLTEWALRYRPSARERRELRLYSDPNKNTSTRRSLGALRAVPGLRDKAAFVYALVFPEASYLEGRYASRQQRWLKGLQGAGRPGARRSGRRG